MLPQLLIFTYVWKYGVIGSIAFSFLVVFLFKTGLVFSALDRNGFLKKRIPLTGYLAMGTVFVGLFMIQAYGYVDMIMWLSVEITFTDLLLLNYALYLFLFAFDTLVIDILVLVAWHPDFLDLPDTVGFTSVKHHLKTIPFGVVAGALLSMLYACLITLFFR